MPDNNPKVMNRQNDGWVYGDVLPIAHNPTSNELLKSVFWREIGGTTKLLLGKTI